MILGTQTIRTHNLIDEKFPESLERVILTPSKSTRLDLMTIFIRALKDAECAKIDLSFTA